MTRERRIVVDEGRRVPRLDVAFGFGPMLPLLAGAASVWLLPEPLRRPAQGLTILWAAAILLFLSGVRRGLSFRTEGGPTFAQIATTLGLFGAGFSALVAVAAGFPVPALVLLLLGHAAVMRLDPIAARTGEAPPYFARLRPLQMALALVALAITLARNV